MTAEDHVAYALRSFYLALPNVEIISFHPPSGKAYETPLVRFPVLKNSAIASKRRHLDFIVRCGRFLILQELKGDAASTRDDQVKLLALQNELGITGVVKTIAKRNPSITKSPAIDRLVLSLGFLGQNKEIPPPFSVFRADKTGAIEWQWSSDLTKGEVAELNNFFTLP